MLENSQLTDFPHLPTGNPLLSDQVRRSDARHAQSQDWRNPTACAISRQSKADTA
jgi:hypothetical protein